MCKSAFELGKFRTFFLLTHACMNACIHTCACKHRSWMTCICTILIVCVGVYVHSMYVVKYTNWCKANGWTEPCYVLLLIIFYLSSSHTSPLSLSLSLSIHLFISQPKTCFFRRFFYCTVCLFGPFISPYSMWPARNRTHHCKTVNINNILRAKSRYQVEIVRPENCSLLRTISGSRLLLSLSTATCQVPIIS